MIAKPNLTASIDAWLDYIHSIHSSTIDLGLDRVKLVGAKLQLTKIAPLVITVAGTNGKGSTCAILEAAFIQAGFNVAVYSSPHLISYTERLRLNHKNVAPELLTQAFSKIEQIRATTSLSFFEFTTLAAFIIMQEQPLDVAIIEVGLGGRLDATNIIDADIAIVSSIALDHQDWLGSDLEFIAHEKAGIFKKGKVAISGADPKLKSIKEYATSIGANFYQIEQDYSYTQTKNDWTWKSHGFELANLPKPNLPIINAATALMALSVCDYEISDENIDAALKNVQLPGRMQKIQATKPLVIADVAHNPQAAWYLAEKLNELLIQRKLEYKNKDIKVHIVLGMLKDKDIKHSIEALSKIATNWYLATLDNPRGATAQQLAFVLQEFSIEKTNCYLCPKQAYKDAVASANEQDIIIVCGSFHTVAAILELQESN